MSEPLNWREKAIADCDEALAAYADLHAWLNADGHHQHREDVVDEILDRRNELARELGR